VDAAWAGLGADSFIDSMVFDSAEICCCNEGVSMVHVEIVGIYESSIRLSATAARRCGSVESTVRRELRILSGRALKK